MKFLLENITHHYIEFDIMQNGGKKIDDNYFFIQYFDFDQTGQRGFSVPVSVHGQIRELFKSLDRLAAGHRRLIEQLTYCFMKESYGVCVLILHSFANPGRNVKIHHRIEFAKNEWANIEDMFLEAGLSVIKKNEKRILSYRVFGLEAKYTVEVNDGKADLKIQTGSIDSLVEALTVIGHSIDEGKISPYRQ